MRHIKYVTDNPYRLLQISSCVTPKELRRVAAKTDKAVQVGQYAGAGLQRVFGSDEIAHCMEIVSSMANDPGLRAFYRMFWPFLYERPSDADDTIQDFDKLIKRYDNPEIFHVVHLRFLKAWFTFLDQQLPIATQSAFEDFHALCEDVAFDDYLAELMQKEGAEATHLDRARNEIIAYLLDTACRQAIEHWEAGQLEQATQLLAIICASPFEEEAIHHALQPVSATGERERQKLIAAIDAYEGWSPSQGTGDIIEAHHLTELAEAIGAHLAVSGLWRETVDLRMGQVANAMRDYALDRMDNPEKWPQCREIIQQLRAMPLSSKWKQTLFKDLRTIDSKEMAVKQETPHKKATPKRRATPDKKATSAWETYDKQAETERKTLYQGIKPLKKPLSPMLRYGCGTKAYGRQPFNPKHGEYLTTLYFVLFYIPLFPLGRYVVRDTSQTGRQGSDFVGEARLSLGSQLHSGVSLSVCVTLFIGIAWYSYNALHLNSSDAGSSTTSVSAMSYTAAPDPAPPPRAPVPSKEEAPLTGGTSPQNARVSKSAGKDLLAGDETVDRETPDVAPSGTRATDAEATRVYDMRDITKQLASGKRPSDEQRLGMMTAVELTRSRLQTTLHQLEQTQRTLQKTSLDIEMKREGLNHYDADAVAAFNARVDQYNQAKDAVNEQADRYEQDRHDFNDAVDAYNKALNAKKRK